MALLDVSEVLNDPLFTDSIVLITRTQTVDNTGTVVLSNATKNYIGSIQPIGGKAFNRLPEEMKIEGMRSFWIKGELQTDVGTTYPPVLVFKGKRYQVLKIDDWSNTGQGYTEGVCITEGPAGG